MISIIAHNKYDLGRNNGTAKFKFAGKPSVLPIDHFYAIIT
jgi:hypothetical protein